MLNRFINLDNFSTNFVLLIQIQFRSKLDIPIFNEIGVSIVQKLLLLDKQLNLNLKKKQNKKEFQFKVGVNLFPDS